MTTSVDLDIAVNNDHTPSSTQFEQWVACALNGRKEDASVSIRVVDLDESQELNLQYRGKDKPTNVLSFPFEIPDGIPAAELNHLIGDLVICAPVVDREAIEQNKPIQDHWAHMTIHGTLHLLGYDHIVESEAEEMEQLERELLASLAIPDPYKGIQ